MKRTLTSGVGLLIALALFVSLNVLGSAALRTARVDLTDHGLYTLSQGSKNILSKLDEPITLRLYFSRKLASDYPQLENYAKRVEDLLTEYARASGGKLKLEVLDPEPFSEIEERALQYGLKGIPVGSANELLYFGLAGTNSTDDEEVIPFFQPDKENLLEYDLSKLVYTLSDPKRVVVGVMSALPLEGAMPDPTFRSMPEPWIVMDQIRQFFEVRTVDISATEIPEEVEVLFIVHPKGLSEDTLYAIDQFVLRGGKAMVFVDSFCEEDQPMTDPSNPLAGMQADRSSTLGKVMEAWGLKLADGVFAGDRTNARVVNHAVGGRPEAVPYVAWLRLPEECFNQEDVVTSQLGVINLASAGVLEVLDGATTQVTPLIETSADSMRIGINRIQIMPNPSALLEEFFSPQKKLLLAARVTGPAKTAFPDRALAKAAETDEGAPGEGAEAAEGDSEESDAETDAETGAEADQPKHLAESTGPINVVVVSDADMLADKWWVTAQNILGMRMITPQADNASFAINSLDNLSGSSDLISLRGREGIERPFKKVAAIERAANERYRAEYQKLEEELRNTEQQINELQRSREGATSDPFMLSSEQQAQLESFREKQVETKRRLREVRYELRKDIDRLGLWMKFLNIWLVPLMILATAVSLWFYRQVQN
jgi:ABC-type uncharacterized transport system involved in gliding motility auxiliary subunit